MSLSTLRPLSD